MQTAAPSADKPMTNSSLTGKYLTFALGEEHYGLEILKVQEIIGVINITRVPKSPNYLKGVINLRGKIIPVLDLRLQLGMEEKSYDDKTCFVVVNAEVNENIIAVGIVVDTVLEVINLDGGQIQPPPEYGATIDTSFILGMGKVGNDVLILLNIDKTLSEAGKVLQKHSIQELQAAEVA